MVKASDAEGHVQKFTPPKTPQSPEESDIVNELKAYENQQVEVEGQTSGGEAAATEEDVCRLSFNFTPFVIFPGSGRYVEEALLFVYSAP